MFKFTKRNFDFLLKNRPRLFQDILQYDFDNILKLEQISNIKQTKIILLKQKINFNNIMQIELSYNQQIIIFTLYNLKTKTSSILEINTDQIQK